MECDRHRWIVGRPTSAFTSYTWATPPWGGCVKVPSSEPLSVRAGAKMVESRRKEGIRVSCLAALAALAGQLVPDHRYALAASLPALL